VLKLNNNLVLNFLFSSFCAIAIAQTPTEEFRAMKAQFPDQEFVFTNYSYAISLELDGDDVVMKYTSTEEGICLNDNFTQYRENSVYASTFREIEELEAYTLVPGTKKYAKEKVEEFSEHTITDGNIFHDDSKQITFNYPKMQRGAKIYKHVEYNVLEPHLMPSFYAAVYRPILNGKFELSVEDGIEIETISKNLDLLDLEKTETRKGAITTYTWQYNDFAGFEYEPDAPSLIYFAPHVLVHIKNINGKTKVTPVLNDINDLHRWYCEFLEQNSADSASSLQSLVDEIVSPEDSGPEAASKIYNWVQKNITYIAVEDGYNGFKPEFATTVCSSRYGDCKGMSNLLQNMLNLRGIESHLTWVGTRDIPYTYEDVPLPSTDNHMIVTYVENGQNYLLDPTHSNLAFKVPSPFIQGKQVLINQDCDNFELYTVPVPDAQDNHLYDSVSVKMDGKDLLGKGYATLTGYMRMSFLSRMRQADYDYLKDYCRSYFQKGSNRFIIDSVWIDQKENANLPLLINYTFSIKDFNLELAGERFVDLNLDAFETPVKIEDNRELPFELQYKLKATSVIELATDGLNTAGELPASNKLGSDQLQFEVNYTQNPSVIKRKSSISIETILLEPEHFESWNQAVSDIQKTKRTRLTLQLNP
jgi:hypothetical protein